MDFRLKIILLVFFVLRLVGITNPPLETSHNWRQVTGLMVARNYVEEDPNFFHPRIDERGSGNGIIGMEFPLMNYGHFALAKVFGFQHWYGRILNLILSTFGVWFFYLLVKRFWRDKTAFFSSLILLVSSWFIFSRKSMPDTASLSFVFIGMEFLFRYLEDKNSRNWIFGTALLSIGVLVKIPSSIYLALFILYIIQNNILWPKKGVLALGLTLAITSGALWYFVWNPHVANLNETWYNAGVKPTEGLQILAQNPSVIFQRFSFSALRSFAAIILAVIGLVFAIKKREKLLLSVFGMLLLTFGAFCIKSGPYFIDHDYYMLPFAPTLALLAGWMLAQIKTTWLVYVLISIVGIEGVANQQHDFFSKDSELHKLNLENIADQTTQPQDLIAIQANPQELYFTHRKGWLLNEDNATDKAFLNEIHHQGCRFVFYPTSKTSTQTPDYKEVYRDDHFVVFEMKTLE